MILSVAWRNIWRNKTRSLIIIAAITIGIFAGVFMGAFVMGWVDQRVDAVIGTEVSHLQIHNPDYLESDDIRDYISGIDARHEEISSMPGVRAVSSRVIVSCMIASPATISGIQLTGIDPENERQVSNIHEKIVDGGYFDDGVSNPVIIGEKLAEKLNVRLRSRVVVTLTGTDGTLTGGAFRVAGIYRTVNTAFDEMKAFVRDNDLRDLLDMDDDAGHQIAILLDNNDIVDQMAGKLSDKFPELHVMPWYLSLPELEMMDEYINMVMFVIMVIILLAMGFGIVNTMLMVILERVKELGMLMAIGMNRLRIFLMIMLETVLLSLTGGVVGIIIAVALTAITAVTGIDLGLWAEGLHSMGFDSVIYPRTDVGYVIMVTLLVVVTGILAAIYPARKALGLHPAESLRTDF